ncbi:hypothetical protein ANOM_010089 [Aspergillus nomiae NRRL 13137]|uniref:RRM domain-containing protein n=1 Tax=Aspergillus nomiae NRRL (strain ATCC 15546 / NRRL 13137 / CBS 260.88 / M93) TaxID=1509407 RepID=A0A0L1IS81_ASPN3|nr:uncharacterized protein ANOM_010089 [Aspergillus nomiae NRRL 13137]KNG82352.1 hypothetical protein ANOM_010089 [Aspergillus nomiae NRRL 13137]
MDFATQNTSGAPEDVHLYVGNLSPRVTEYMLTETFAATGAVQHLKIIPDRNYQHGGLNYALVKYFDIQSAKTAVQTLNGLKLFDTEIQVSWANQIQQDTRDAPGQYRVIVGDLSPEVNDDILRKAFSAFSSLSDARVIWDLQSGKSRGHGFLIFSDKTDAEQAIATMNGDWLGSRAITVSWANQKPQGSSQNSESVSYESILLQAPPDQTTVYIGNLVPYCTQADLIPIFQSLGYLKSIEMHADQGHASVHLDTHEHAAMAICQLHGQMVHGRPIKLGVCTEKRFTI